MFKFSLAFSLLAVAFVAQSQPLPLPSPLKGINYFPRGHAWYSMVYDWYTQDCATSTVPQSCVYGQTVSQVVASDLQTLHQNGFNFIHLYLWDQDLIQETLNSNASLVSQGSPGPGFVGWDDGGPQNSPNNQWNALGAFVSLAKSNGIWVFLEFAVGRPAKEISLGYSSGTVGTNYANWVNEFIDNMAGSQNVLIWGITYGISSPSVYQSFWGAAYPAISGNLHQYVYSSPPGWALLAVDAQFYGPMPLLSQLGLYEWTWQAAQQQAYQWNLFAYPPDLYAFQLYNANAGDLQAALECVAGTACPASQGTCGSYCSTIPFAKMIPTEFATGSSLESQPIGNGLAAYLDANTATTTAAGQAQWLTETLCALSRHNLPNTGWYGLYDTASWWEQYYGYTGDLLAQNGYWGLKSEVSNFSNYGAGGIKPAWNAMIGFSPSSCPSPTVPPTPVLAIQTDATYYTVNDTGTLTYTDANVTSLTLNEPPVGSNFQAYDCKEDNPLTALGLLSSCAFTTFTAANTGTITLTGTNNDVDGGLQQSPTSSAQAVGVTVGPAPIIGGIIDYSTGQLCNYVTNPSCVLPVGPTDILEIFGLGFSPSGGNTVELVLGFSEGWFYAGDGSYYWDASRTQINAQLSSLYAGTWTLYVWNPHSNSASNGVAVQVQ
jgi:hypothetical protein